MQLLGAGSGDGLLGSTRPIPRLRRLAHGSLVGWPIRPAPLLGQLVRVHGPPGPLGPRLPLIAPIHVAAHQRQVSLAAFGHIGMHMVLGHPHGRVGIFAQRARGKASRIGQVVQKALKGAPLAERLQRQVAG